jgi:hypothetical protein
MNPTVPVGTPRPAGALVISAVNVTDWPRQDELVEALKVVRVSVVWAKAGPAPNQARTPVKSIRHVPFFI